VLRGRWCGIIILNAHGSTEDEGIISRTVAI
jgi:hypothetical protein